MFSMICAWTNGWANNRDAGNLQRLHAHYNVTVMIKPHFTHCGLVTPHGGIDLGQDWIMSWLDYPNSWWTWNPSPLNYELVMMTSSNGNIFRVTGPLCGEFTSPGEFPTQRPVTRNFDVFFHLRLNKRLSKQQRGWWFETLSRTLWRHCNVIKYREITFSYKEGKLLFLLIPSWMLKAMLAWYDIKQTSFPCRDVQ